MKALTLLYEQHKLASLAPKNPNLRYEDGRGEDDETGEAKNQVNSYSTVTRNFVLPKPPNEDGKENFTVIWRACNVEKIVGFSCQRNEVEAGRVARKLAMGTGLAVPQSEPRGFGGFRNLQEVEGMKENVNVAGCSRASGSRILVFVRLPPMAKKEKEAGARCFVRIVNGRDVYLTEFAAEHDYLRLKRVRGRHFAFDASFPDSTSSMVYVESKPILSECPFGQ